MFQIFQVFPDAFTKRELNGLHLHCANHGCSWQSTYKVLEVSHHPACKVLTRVLVVIASKRDEVMVDDFINMVGSTP